MHNCPTYMLAAEAHLCGGRRLVPGLAARLLMAQPMQQHLRTILMRVLGCSCEFVLELTRRLVQASHNVCHSWFSSSLPCICASPLPSYRIDHRQAS